MDRIYLRSRDLPAKLLAALLGLVLAAGVSADADAATCTYELVDDWNSGFKGQITISNDGAVPITDWNLNWAWDDGAEFREGWRASYSCTGSRCSATPPSWNPVIAAGGSFTFEFLADKASAGPAQEQVLVSGDICGAPAPAWRLDDASSSVLYVSVKAEHRAELSGFVGGQTPALAGSISPSGEAVLAIDLNAVATSIDIRDGRLRDFLFETTLLPTAWFRTNLAADTLTTLAVGELRREIVEGSLSLHGVRQSVTAELLIARLTTDQLRVTTLAPILVRSADFDMAAGIETLRSLANLSSIGEAVPVYLDLRFEAAAAGDSPVSMPEAPMDPDLLVGLFDAPAALAVLDWLDNSTIETDYLVRRRPLDGDWRTVAELPPNSTTLTEGLPDSGEYDYKVIALNQGVPSLPSNVARVTVTTGNQLVRGQQIYQQQCAGCHGTRGEGVGSNPALNTERDLATMIAYIRDFMPQGNPGACADDCPADVAAYIETFWVRELACNRLETPISYGARQLKILTRAEYQRSVEDLLGVDFDAGGGLSADAKVGFFLNNTHTSVNAASYSNFLLVAEELATWAADRDFAPALSCGGVIDAACADQLIDGLAPRIFRRPLTSDERATYAAIASGSAADGDVAAGMQLALEGLLSSPEFLYRSELGEPNPANPLLDDDAFELTSYEMATFLAYTFTGSTPDDELLAAASRDELRIESEIVRHANRLAGNADEVLARFVGSWLGTEDLALAAKDPNVSPAYAAFPDLVPLMQQELNRTFSHIMLDPAESFATLYNADFTYLNAALAAHYGVSGVSGDGFRQVATTDRGGILASGAFMARWAEAEETSPILRSVRVRRRMLCQDQPDPPAGTFAAREEKLAELSDILQDPATTNRLKYHLLTEDAPCSNCHEQYINPLGFGMEDFDTLGRLRSSDLNGNIVDAMGELYAPLRYSDLDDVLPFDGTRQLGEVLAGLESAQSCLTKQLFRYLTGVGHQNIDPDNPEGPELAETEQAGYACEIESLTDALLDESPRAMLEQFGPLEAVRYRKAWPR